MTRVVRRKKLSYEEKEFVADGWKGKKVFEAEFVPVSESKKFNINVFEISIPANAPGNFSGSTASSYYELKYQAGELPPCCNNYGYEIPSIFFGCYDHGKKLLHVVWPCAYPEFGWECHRREYEEVPNIFNRDADGYSQRGYKILMKIWEREVKKNDRD